MRTGERIRIEMTNSTSMWHPMHLHGHTFGVPEYGRLRRDTVIIHPGQSLAFEFDADEGAGAATGTTVQVRVLDMKFDPAVVTISPGDTVEWVWEASLPHDVASMEGAPVAFASELQTSGTYAQTFETAGVYDYTCTPHPQMTGQVIVEG